MAMNIVSDNGQTNKDVDCDEVKGVFGVIRKEEDRNHKFC